jgi:hypothetical protein
MLTVLLQWMGSALCITIHYFIIAKMINKNDDVEQKHTANVLPFNTF